MRNTEKALKWIVKILRKHNAPFQISGGFAAKLYGSKRDLADIDIEVSQKHFKQIVPEIKPYIFFGPDWFHDKNWTLFYAKLKYEDQKIDFCEGETLKIIDDKTGKVVIDGIDFSECEMKEAFGIKIPVMPKEKLIAYKKVLDRDVDRADVVAMESSNANKNLI